MKRKILVFASLIAFGITANAQRPEEGANPFSLEGGLSLSGTTFTAPSVRLRYFAADNIAVRVGLSFDNTSSTTNFYDVDTATFLPIESSMGTEVVKSSMTWISVGGSYHFSQLEKLSPYAALDIMYGMGSDVTTGDMTDGAMYDADVSYESTMKTSGLGVNIAGGFDYYFAQNVFIGAELGFMYQSSNDKGGEASSTVGGTTNTVEILPAGKSSSFMNGASGIVRLGWRF